MQIRASLYEIARNICTGTTRLALLFFTAAGIVTTISLADAITVSHIVSAGTRYVESGAAITTLALAGRIDGHSCDALSRSDGVVASGAVREKPSVGIDVLPNSPLKLYEASPGFAQVLGSAAHDPGVIASDNVVALIGDTDHRVNGVATHIASTFTYPQDGRRPGFGWALVSPTQSRQAFDECWAMIWPERTDTRRLLLTTVTASGKTAATNPQDEPKISQLNSRLGARFLGANDYDNRATRFGPLVAAVLGACLGFVAIRHRKIEIASNLHAGASKLSLALQSMFETSSWALAATIVSFSTSFVAVGKLVDRSAVAGMSVSAALTATTFFTATLLGTVIAVVSIREKRLWTYVRS